MTMGGTVTAEVTMTVTAAKDDDNNIDKDDNDDNNINDNKGRDDGQPGDNGHRGGEENMTMIAPPQVGKTSANDYGSRGSCPFIPANFIFF